MNSVTRAGFSLVDALMSIALFALLTSGLVGALAYAYQSSTSNQQHIHAIELADEGIEAVRSLREGAWNGMTLTQSGVNSDLGTWQWVGEGTTDTLGNYTRTITLNPVCRNSSNDIATCPSSYTDVRSKYVTVAITWTGQFGSSRSYSEQTLITNWDTSAWSQTDWSGGSGQATWSSSNKYDSDTGDLSVSTAGQVSIGPTVGCGVQTWDIGTASDYTASSSSISISGGTASLVANGSAPDSNTVGLWHLNESSGNLVDSSGKNNTLTPTGSLTYDSAGTFGTGIGFGGTDFYGSIADASQTGLDVTGTITVEAWIKKAVFSGSDMIVRKWGSTTADQSYQFFIGNSGTVAFQLRNGASTALAGSGAGSITTGVWYHVAGVYDGSTIKVYINGHMSGSVAYSAGIANGAAAFTISDVSTASFNGTIDEVRVSNVARYTTDFTVPTHPFGVYYDSTSPTLTVNQPYSPTHISQWVRMVDSTTVSGSSQVAYQLSDDGSTWKYWNGSSWATAASNANANSTSVINTNITTFSTTAKKLYWRAIFFSEGSDPVSLDSVALTCQLNQQWDFSTPSDYSYSSDITVSGGTATLTANGSSPDSNTVGLWHLDESSGSFTDYSGHNNTLAVTGTPTYSASGQFGSAVTFGSTDHYGSITDASQSGLDVTGNLTIEAWINKTVMSGSDIIVAKWGGTTDVQSYQLFIGNLGTLAFQVRNGASTALATSPTGTITTGTWYHVAGVYDGSTLKVYVNGAMVGSVAYSAGIADTTSSFLLSGVSTGSFNGTIDEVRISNVARYTSDFTVPTHPFGVYYSNTTPTLTLATPFSASSMNLVPRWIETATKSGSAQLYYQLSNDGGTTWQYWNGSAWATASAATNYNTASVVATNIKNFTVPSGTLQFKVFFVSAGSDQLSLDTLSMYYQQNISAGIDTSAKLTSSAFNLGAVSNITSIQFTKDTSSCTGCSVMLQVRAAPDSGGAPGTWSQWYGATGAGTFFTNSGGTLIPTSLNGYQWVQYRVGFTSDGSVSPIFNDVTIFYDPQ